MSRYSVSNSLGGAPQSLSGTFKTIVTLNAATATLQRALIYDILVSADSSMRNSIVLFDWSRQTAPGTATAVTPNPLDEADTAAGTAAEVNATAEGTVTADSSVLSFALNSRLSRRWQARDAKASLVIPATNFSAIVARALSPNYTSTVTVTEMFAE